MRPLLIENATIINEGKTFRGHVLCTDGLIKEIFSSLPESIREIKSLITINAEDKILLPGVIDDQVHFREPGLTHKGDIYSESRAAVAGGITSYMEMPNTSPPTTSMEMLNKKREIAEKNSLANYSFYLGATNNNIMELVNADPLTVCGIKIFMGSSTGNMLVDNEDTLRAIFSKATIPVAVHCEDENTIKTNTHRIKSTFGENIPAGMHPVIRSEEACYLSSAYAARLAKEYGTRLHILHLSTARELDLFEKIALSDHKRITAEVCIHHLWFNDTDYEKEGARIKWNPSVKTENDRRALINAVKNDIVDIIATDHAPHTEDEKKRSYFNSPSGGPMVQHSLAAMLEFVNKGELSVEKVVEKMCHAPALLFKIDRRGFIREGYHADLVLVDRNRKWTVSKDNILYKCGWSPMEGVTFSSMVTHTIVNGNIVYDNGNFNEKHRGRQLVFNR